MQWKLYTTNAPGYICIHITNNYIYFMRLRLIANCKIIGAAHFSTTLILIHGGQRALPEAAAASFGIFQPTQWGARGVGELEVHEENTGQVRSGANRIDFFPSND